MSTLKTLVAHQSIRASFPDYRSFSVFLAGRSDRLPKSLVRALTMDHGRIWRTYYRKLKGFDGTHELLVFGSAAGVDKLPNNIEGVVLRRSGSNGKQRLSLLYGLAWVIRSSRAVGRFEKELKRKELAEQQEAEAAGIYGPFDDEEDD
jgi:hypothetical protein